MSSATPIVTKAATDAFRQGFDNIDWGTKAEKAPAADIDSQAVKNAPLLQAQDVLIEGHPDWPPLPAPDHYLPGGVPVWSKESVVAYATSLLGPTTKTVPQYYYPVLLPKDRLPR